MITSLITRIFNWQDRLLGQLHLLDNPALLFARLYVAEVFFRSGLTKIKDWDSTLYLFSEEYHVPILPPEVAAYMGTGGELILPVLLFFGILGRFSALGLLILNIVAVMSLSDMSPAALGQHVLWGALLTALAIWGVGKLSLDTLLQRWFTASPMPIN
jgi:putative oxidoreductase